LDIVNYLVDTFQLTAADACVERNFAFHYARNNGHQQVIEFLATLGRVEEKRKRDDILVQIKSQFGLQ